MAKELIIRSSSTEFTRNKKIAIFADVDNTLRTPGNPMSKEVKCLIQRIMEFDDVLWVYCTGKPCAYMSGAITEWQTPSAYILGSNGAVLYKGATMPPSEGCEIFPFNENELKQFRTFMSEMYKRLENVKGIFWQPNGEADDFVATPFWGNNMNVKDKVMKVFYELWQSLPHNELNYFENMDALDIMVASIDKAKGMLWCAKQEGISIDKCYALGDSDNDLPMLQVAKKFNHDYVVGKHIFDGYEPTYRFETYEEMLSELLFHLMQKKR